MKQKQNKKTKLVFWTTEEEEMLNFLLKEKIVSPFIIWKNQIFKNKNYIQIKNKIYQMKLKIITKNKSITL